MVQCLNVRAFAYVLLETPPRLNLFVSTLTYLQARSDGGVRHAVVDDDSDDNSDEDAAVLHVQTDVPTRRQLLDTIDWVTHELLMAAAIQQDVTITIGSRRMTVLPLKTQQRGQKRSHS